VQVLPAAAPFDQRSRALGGEPSAAAWVRSFTRKVLLELV